MEPLYFYLQQAACSSQQALASSQQSALDFFFFLDSQQAAFSLQQASFFLQQAGLSDEAKTVPKANSPPNMIVKIEFFIIVYRIYKTLICKFIAKKASVKDYKMLYSKYLKYQVYWPDKIGG